MKIEITEGESKCFYLRLRKAKVYETREPFRYAFFDHDKHGRLVGIELLIPNRRPLWNGILPFEVSVASVLITEFAKREKSIDDVKMQFDRLKNDPDGRHLELYFFITTKGRKKVSLNQQDKWLNAMDPVENLLNVRFNFHFNSPLPPVAPYTIIYQGGR